MSGATAIPLPTMFSPHSRNGSMFVSIPIESTIAAPPIGSFNPPRAVPLHPPGRLEGMEEIVDSVPLEFDEVRDVELPGNDRAAAGGDDRGLGVVESRRGGQFDDGRPEAPQPGGPFVEGH